MAGLTPEPELYALLHRGTPGDEAFYLDACGGADSVLEFGCGHGRLMVPLAREGGHRITGIDCDDGLLGLARRALAAHGERAVCASLHRADMRTVDLAQRFDRVVIPYNGLYCMPCEADQVACLVNAARHLAPGGRVVFDAYAIDTFHFEADEGENDADDEPVASIAWRGTTWNVHETCGWDRAAQRLHVDYRYQPADSSAVVHQRIDHRYLLTGQVPQVCDAAGLRILQIAGGFLGEPFDRHSEHLVCIAEAAG